MQSNPQQNDHYLRVVWGGCLGVVWDEDVRRLVMEDWLGLTRKESPVSIAYLP